MVNYFKLFQLPMQLPIDMDLLANAYQQLQHQYHPDNFATCDESDKLAAIQKSSMVNSGYMTLKTPITAAEHFLLLSGLNINSESNIIHDSSFLMEQFELREQLDSLDCQVDTTVLNDFYDDILFRKQTVYNNLLADITKKNWHSAINNLYKIRYITKLLEQIEKQQEAGYMP